jgi:hypothetical protein
MTPFFFEAMVLSLSRRAQAQGDERLNVTAGAKSVDGDFHVPASQQMRPSRPQWTFAEHLRTSRLAKRSQREVL